MISLGNPASDRVEWGLPMRTTHFPQHAPFRSTHHRNPVDIIRPTHYHSFMSKAPQFFYARIWNDDLCVYCGDEAVVEDHFLPKSKARNFPSGHFLLPACYSCNGIASSKVFETLDDKMKFIHDRLKVKNTLLLSYGSSENIKCPNQRTLEKKFKLLRRLSWRNRDNPAGVFLAGIHIDPNGIGKSFVRVPVEQIIINASGCPPWQLGEEMKPAAIKAWRRKFKQNAR